MMFKPFEIYLKKQLAKSRKDDENEENSATNEEEIREKWANLSNRKRLKVIKKAERKYDSSEEEDKQPFHSYLTDVELEMLMKSYDFPNKPPPNVRNYYINKNLSENENQLAANARTEAEESWKNLDVEEKAKIKEEYHKLFDSYEEEYLNFVRNLPEQRVDDFKHFLSSKKKSHTDSDNSGDNSGEKTTKRRKRAKKDPQRRIRKGDTKLFVPLENYIERHREEYEADKIPLEERNRFRSEYSILSDGEKLKYIKSAEENYDSFDFQGFKEKPLFTSFLNKTEIQILFDAYDIPEQVPKNLASYFMKKMYKSGTHDVKVVFRRFREMSENEKEALLKEHNEQCEKYSKELRLFIERLPRSRLSDYERLKWNKITAKKRSSAEDGSSSDSSRKRVRSDD